MSRIKNGMRGRREEEAVQGEENVRKGVVVKKGRKGEVGRREVVKEWENKGKNRRRRRRRRRRY